MMIFSLVLSLNIFQWKLSGSLHRLISILLRISSIDLPGCPLNQKKRKETKAKKEKKQKQD